MVSMIWKRLLRKREKRGLDEEKVLISRQLNILHTNLFKMIKPCLKENETRAMFLRILFKILADNRNEDTLSQGSTDQFTVLRTVLWTDNSPEMSH